MQFNLIFIFTLTYTPNYSPSTIPHTISTNSQNSYKYHTQTLIYLSPPSFPYSPTMQTHTYQHHPTTTTPFRQHTSQTQPKFQHITTQTKQTNTIKPQHITTSTNNIATTSHPMPLLFHRQINPAMMELLLQRGNQHCTKNRISQVQEYHGNLKKIK